MLDARQDLNGFSAEYEGLKFTSLLLSDVNQKLGQVPTERAGLSELVTFAATMPFRAISQDTSYAFLRGLNRSNIFFQNPTAAAGTGFWLEPNADTCTDGALKLVAAASNADATKDDHLKMWGFKEHPFVYNYFYIYNRKVGRADCMLKWLAATVTTASCIQASPLVLTHLYGDDSLWSITRNNAGVITNPPTV